MKVLYLTHFDSNDIRACSGTIYHVKQMLKDQGHDVLVVDNLKISVFVKCFFKVIAKIKRKNTLVGREPFVLKSFARQIKRRVKHLEYDLVFSPSSLYYTYYIDNKSMVYYTDATLGGMMDYYIFRENYSKRAINDGYRQEEKAIENSDLIIFASDWAKKTAVDIHKADPKKCMVVNRGANVKHKLNKNEVVSLINGKSLAKGENKCNFMFLGADWERKGGPLACEIARLLNEQYGIQTMLTVIGCEPNVEQKYKKYINVLGYLDKSKKWDYEKLEQCFKESDFFLLPTRREAQGISYTEACSWGMPVIGTNTGGVSGVIKHGVNGLLLEETDGAEVYAEQIMVYVKSKEDYVRLAESTVNYFMDNLTWEVVGKKISTMLERVLLNDFKDRIRQ